MNTLKRQVLLNITVDGNPILESSSEGLRLRVDFNIVNQRGSGADTATISVYNINEELIQGLTGGVVEVDLSVLAGDIKNPIFSGVVSNIFHQVHYQDSILTLYCWDKGCSLLKKSVSLSGRNMKRSSIIDGLAKEAGFLYIHMDKSDSTWVSNMEITKPATTLQGVLGDVLDRLRGQYRFDYHASGESLFVYPLLNLTTQIGGWKEGGRKVYQPVIEQFCKPIEMSVEGATIYLSLTPEVRVGELLEVPSGSLSTTSSYSTEEASYVHGIVGKLQSNLYIVDKIIHSGSEYTDDWQSAITARYQPYDLYS